jgi:signal transduction histidine kinase
MVAEAADDGSREDGPLGRHAAAGARAERAMLDVFLWMRISHLGAGLVSLLLDRRRYRRPALALVTLGVVASESMWLARRSRRAGGFVDPVVTTVDTAVGCAGLVACAVALHPDDQFGSSNWMFPLTLFSAVGASAGLRERRQSIAATVALLSTYSIATNARTTGRVRQSLFGAFQYAGCFVGGDLLIRRHRGNAVLIEQAGRDAVERAGSVAREHERARLNRELHVGALSTLEALRAEWQTDRTRARTIARREAIRLRRAIRSDHGVETLDVAFRLEEVARDLAGSGMRCELLVDDVEELSPPVATAVVDAVRAALQNVIEHSGAAHAIVRVAGTKAGIEITVRDRGRGSDRHASPPSVVDPIRHVGGEVEWWSVPGRGARVAIRVGS